MTSLLLQAVGELVLLLLGGVALAWILRGLELTVRVSPLPPRMRMTLLRFAPALELVLVVAYVASGAAVLWVHEPTFAKMLTPVVGLALLFAWPLLYDLMSGVVFRVTQPCQVGDLVHMPEVEGRVLQVSTRALVVQTRDGDVAVVPYGQIARKTLRRTQSVEGAYVHAFELTPRDLAEASASRTKAKGGNVDTLFDSNPDAKDDARDEGFAELKRRIVDAAMRCHWASVVHEPKVERRKGGVIEVSVYAHDAAHAPQVEDAVRTALARGSTGGAARTQRPVPPTRSRVLTPPPFPKS